MSWLHGAQRVRFEKARPVEARREAQLEVQRMLAFKTGTASEEHQGENLALTVFSVPYPPEVDNPWAVLQAIP